VIYELREYTATPGRAERLHDRFRDHVLQLFERHGLEVVGYWTDAMDDGRVLYLLRFPNEETRTAGWAAFQADPEWHEVKSESEADGPIVAEMTSRVLSQPTYWTGTTALLSQDREECAP